MKKLRRHVGWYVAIVFIAGLLLGRSGVFGPPQNLLATIYEWGRTRNVNSLGGFEAACSTFSFGTLIISDVQTVAADATQPLTVVLHFVGEGRIEPASGKKVTVRANMMIAPPGQQIFGGDGDISISGTIYGEWFGAVADAYNASIVGATDNFPAFSKAIKALWLGGGGIFKLQGGGTSVSPGAVSWSGYAYYLSSYFFKVDCVNPNGLPDGSTAVGQEDIKPIIFEGEGHSRSIIVSDAADKIINVIGGVTASTNIQGKYIFKNFSLQLLDRTSATCGIYWQDCVHGNVIDNVFVAGGYYGFYFKQSYNNSFKMSRAIDPSSVGIVFEACQNFDIVGVYTTNSDNIGWYFLNNAALSIVNGGAGHDLRVPVRFRGGNDAITLSDFYIEPGDGEEGGVAQDRNIIEILTSDGTVNQAVGPIAFKRLRLNTGHFTVAAGGHNPANVNVFWISSAGGLSGTAALKGLSIDGVTLPAFKTECAGNVYLVNNDSVNNVAISGSELGKLRYVSPATTFTSVFNSTATALQFSYVQTNESEFVSIRKRPSLSYTFWREDLLDNTPNQALLHAPITTSINQRCTLPWACSLVGLGLRVSGVGAGSTITIHEAASGLSQVFDTATTQSHVREFAFGAHVKAAGSTFQPLINVSGVGGNTQDIIVDYHFEPH